MEKCQLHEGLRADIRDGYQELRESLTQLAELVASLYEWKAAEAVSYQYLSNSQKDLRACIDDVKKNLQELRNTKVSTEHCKSCIIKLETSLTVLEQELNQLRMHGETRGQDAYSDMRDRIEEAVKSSKAYADSINQDTRGLLWKLLGAILTVIGIGLPVVIIMLRMIIELLRSGGGM